MNSVLEREDSQFNTAVRRTSSEALSLPRTFSRVLLFINIEDCYNLK